MDSSQSIESETHQISDNLVYPPWADMDVSISPLHHGITPQYSGLFSMDTTYGMSILQPDFSLPFSTISSSWSTMSTHQSSLHEAETLPGLMRTSVQPSSLARRARKTSAGRSTLHTTLTDEDRRKICSYQEENKIATQAEIGRTYAS